MSSSIELGQALSILEEHTYIPRLPKRDRRIIADGTQPAGIWAEFWLEIGDLEDKAKKLEWVISHAADLDLPDSLMRKLSSKRWEIEIAIHDAIELTKPASKRSPTFGG